MAGVIHEVVCSSSAPVHRLPGSLGSQDLHALKTQQIPIVSGSRLAESVVRHLNRAKRSAVAASVSRWGLNSEFCRMQCYAVVSGVCKSLTTRVGTTSRSHEVRRMELKSADLVTKPRMIGQGNKNDR